MENKEIKICKRCVMTSEVEEFVLDNEGICNFCKQAEKSLKEVEVEKTNLNKWLDKIQKDGRGKDYDCLCGLSGGVDSSTTLYYAVKMGLRVLAFTMDNSHNDPRADENVLKLVEALEVPLYRYVLDIDKFKELQQAYLKAGVMNIEAVYDNLLAGASYEVASQYGIKWILSGGNTATESIMPESWSYRSGDLVNMKDIYQKMTGKKLKKIKGSFPLFGLWDFNLYKWVKKIKVFYLLDYLHFGYNRGKEEYELIKNYGYQSCGEKHEENQFTKWYQNCYLPIKFGIDKRKAHFSSLIVAEQLTREEAIKKLEEPLNFKLLIKPEEFMKYPKRSHYDFKTDKWFLRISKIIKFLRNWKSLANIKHR